MIVSEIINYGHTKAKLAWFDNNHELPSPITQVTGYCFNKQGKILIARNKRGHWVFPGGHPKKEERPIETLEREIWEETKVRIKNPQYIGYQKVEFLKKPYPKEGKIHYQLRYVCRVKKIKKFTPDFETIERKFVSLDELENFIPWIKGKVAQIQFELLVDFYQSQNKSR